MSKRKADDKDKVDPSARVKLRGLEWDASAAKPAFLRNAAAALSGPRRAADGSTTRAPIPTRPDDDQQGPSDDEDEWGLGGGDEAPTVVVLKEGKHLDRDQVDELRQQAKELNEKDPLAPAPEKEKAKPTLQFSSGSSSKAKAKVAVEEGAKSWEDVVKRAKAPAQPENGESDGKLATDSAGKKDSQEAIEKKKRKDKKKQKQQIGLLSFS